MLAGKRRIRLIGLTGVFFGCFVWTSFVFGGNASPIASKTLASIPIKEMNLEQPGGWTIHQKAFNSDVYIFGFAKEGEFVTIFAKKGTGMDMKKLFVNGSTIEKDVADVRLGSRVWKILETSKTRSGGGDQPEPGPSPDDPEEEEDNSDNDSDNPDDQDSKIFTSNAEAKVFITSFLFELNGYTYYGYSRSSDRAKAMDNVTTFLKVLN